MNGFVRSILSVLLQWFKLLVTSLWSLFSGEKSASFLEFASRNWKTLVIVLLVLGVAADFIVYFLRWRPNLVWQTMWRKLFGKHPAKETAIPEREKNPPETPPVISNPMAQQTAAMAPTRQFSLPSEGTKKWKPEALTQKASSNFEPVFDEDVPDWQGPAVHPTSQPVASFSQPTPERMMDVQNGFARPVSPEILYSGSAAHPGLERSTIQQHLGAFSDDLAFQRPAEPEFHPLTETRATVETDEKKPRRFSGFASRAKNLIGLVDDENRPTVSDLHQTVDVSQAFHAPVYPHEYDQKG